MFSMLLLYTASDTSYTTKWVPMFTDISVVPTSEVHTVAMSIYVSVTTETSFQVIGHFERMA